MTLKPLVILIAGFVSPLAQAVDFRATELGAACQGIAQYEQAHGSQLTMQHHGEMMFRGEYLDHQATIKYACHDSRLMRGSYTFWFDDFNDARQFYLDHKGDLIMRYGPPNIDQASAGYLDYMASIGFEVKESHRYVLLWQGADYSITYGANPAADERGSGWVTIDITQHH